MQIKLKNTEIQEYVNAPAGEFPKYTTQLRIPRIAHLNYLRFIQPFFLI